VLRAGSGLLPPVPRGAPGAPAPQKPAEPAAEPVHGARQGYLSLNSRKRQPSCDNLLAAYDAAMR
jgi:hypothetical protein